MELHTNTVNTGMAIICYQTVRNKWCVTSVEHEIFIMMMLHMLPLITMTHLEAGEKRRVM
jgi:hypothetical protein